MDGKKRKECNKGKYVWKRETEEREDRVENGNGVRREEVKRKEDNKWTMRGYKGGGKMEV